MSESRLGERIAGVVLSLALMCAVPTAASAQEAIRVAADAATRSLLVEAESLIARGDSEGAWALLQPREADLAGHPVYDYLLGIAALDTGRSGEAILSLERSLSVAPRFSGARMELARAYYESGNRDLARPLFLSLREENPPPAVAAVIDGYLRSIDRAEAPPASRFAPYLDLFAGYDSNANGSTDDQQFLGFTLSPDNVETESPFAELGAGFDWLAPSSPRFAWIANGRASQRINTDASFVDATILRLLGGVSWQRERWFGRAALDGYWGARDGDPNEHYAGLDALAGRHLAGRWDLTFGIRAGTQRFDESIEVLDVDRFLYTLGIHRRFDNGAQLGLQAIGGNDDARRAGSPYGNSKLGARLFLSAPLGASALLFASLGTLTSDYDGLFFGAEREDSQLSSVLQVEFRDLLVPGLALVPRIRYVNNDSDVALYSYDRMELGVAIRWTPR